MNKIALYISMILLLAITACAKTPKTLAEYNAMEGSRVNQTVEPMNYELQFLPHRFNKKSKASSAHILNFKLKLEDGSRQSILLSGSKEAQSQKLNYYSENIRHDIKLIMKKDTIPCGMVICERNYNMYPFTNLLLSFDIGEDTQIEQARIELTDQLANTGKLNFTFKKRILALNE